MSDIGIDVIADVLHTVASAAGAILFTVVGAVVDGNGLRALMAGSTAQGAWELWMGTLAIFVGIYLLGYRTVLPAITGRD